MKGVKITGMGRALPEQILTNEELSLRLKSRGEEILSQYSHKRDLWSGAVKELSGEVQELAMAELAKAELVLEHYHANKEQFETSDEWIFKRTGIRQRHIASPDENTSDLAARAAEAAMSHAGVDRQDMEFIALGTVSADNWTSPPACARVQNKLGIQIRTEAGLKQLMCFDLEAACSTFPAILATGYGLVSSGIHGRGLIIGADVMSRTLDWDSRNASIVFGDGAFAMVLEETDLESSNFLGPHGFLFGADGIHADKIVVKAGGVAEPVSDEMLWNPFDKRHKVYMDGRAVYEDIVPTVSNEVIPQVVQRAGLTPADIDFIVLHQANMRMNQAVEKRIRKRGFESIVYHDIANYANTTSATQGLALYDAHQENVLKPGMLVLDCAFGGGYTWGAILFRWPELPVLP